MTFQPAGSRRHCVELIPTHKDTLSGHAGPRHCEAVQCLINASTLMETPAFKSPIHASHSHRRRLRLKTAATLPHGSCRLPPPRWIDADPPPPGSAHQAGHTPQECAGVRAGANPPAHKTPGRNQRPHLQPRTPGPPPRRRFLVKRFSRWREPVFFLPKVGGLEARVESTGIWRRFQRLVVALVMGAATRQPLRPTVSWREPAASGRIGPGPDDHHLDVIGNIG